MSPRRKARASISKVYSNQRQFKNTSESIDSTLDHGAKVVFFLRSLYGSEKADAILAMVMQRLRPNTDGDIIDLDPVEVDAGFGEGKLPYGFWQHFFKNGLQTQITKSKHMRYHRGFELYLRRRLEGASTKVALRGLRAAGSHRSDGGALNSRKAPGLGFSLLQWFVDEVRRLQCRSDSCMLLAKAREIRGDLVHKGHRDMDLPKLVGSAGAHWFARWRKMYHIVKKVTGMKLKCPWKKVKRRIRVLLGNMFRLRAFWEICHKDKPMRWLSIDQKPSWFNNAGNLGTLAEKGGSQPSVREDFNQTRQRYSILTSVQSWSEGLPPKVAVLFKAQPGGTIIQKLTERPKPPWMKVQVQENGSYKSADMVEALQWMLPDARTSEDSIVVMLDWYQGHLTEEVAAAIRAKGHVLLFHGGGCTPFTQVNDTHLHALLQRFLTQLEVQYNQAQRKQAWDAGRNIIPKATRESVLDLVEAAWKCLPHASLAEKGYKQTGPLMALTGPVKPEDVFRDLLRCLHELEPSSTPTEVGMTLRDEAVAFVQEGEAAGKWKTWEDCHLLIEEQDGPGDALAEGLEAFGSEADTDSDSEEELDDDDPDDDDDDDDDGGANGDDDPGPDVDGSGGPGGVSKEAPAGASLAASAEDGTGVAAGSSVAPHPSAAGAPSHSAAACDDMSVVTARRILFAEAMRTQDNAMINRLRKRIRDDNVAKKDAATEVGQVLLDQANAVREDQAKRRKEAVKEDRRAAKDLENIKLRTAAEQRVKDQIRLETLKQIQKNRDDLWARRREEHIARSSQKWLQTEYPCKYARVLIKRKSVMSPKDLADWTKTIDTLLEQKVFARTVHIQDLWMNDAKFTLDFGKQPSFTGGHAHQVRCGFLLSELIAEYVPKTFCGEEPAETLQHLFDLIVPRARKIFTQKQSFTCSRILHKNDYQMDKAFIYGVCALSKWLGEEKFPAGVFGDWPPTPPKEKLDEWAAAYPVCPSSLVSGPIHHSAPASSSSSAKE